MGVNSDQYARHMPQLQYSLVRKPINCSLPFYKNTKSLAYIIYRPKSQLNRDEWSIHVKIL